MVSQVQIVDSKALAKAVFSRRAGEAFQQRAGELVRTPEKSLREIAGEIGVSASTLSRVERELLPDLETYIKICRWLSVPFEQFIRA